MKQPLSNDLTNIIVDLFFEVDIDSILCFLSTKTEIAVSIDSSNQFILSDSEIQKDIFISCILIRQLVKANNVLAKQKLDKKIKC